MTYRIGWISPFTSASGVGTFSNGVTRAFPETFKGEAIDLTILHPDHPRLYQSEHRCLTIENAESFHQILPLFDLLVYNIGNNREHHDAIFRMLRIHPGLIICHDYVYQHYLAEQSLRQGKNFSSYAALLTKYGDASTSDYLKRSRITSRIGKIRYSPWDSEYSVQQPMSEALLTLGSALIVHSDFAYSHARKAFDGPLLKLGMPHDQKPGRQDDLEQWERALPFTRTFHLVSFGHIQSTKCIDLVLDAIAGSKVLRSKLRYTVAGFVGDKAYFSDLQRMVANSGLDEIVTFEIGVSEARLGDLMRDADVFVNLRKPNTEGSSASLIEQLTAGRPVILLDSGCYGEVDADAAVKLPADASGADIRRALEHLIGKSELMPAIARAGQMHARRFSCASYADRLLAFVWEHRDLLRERGRVVAVQKTGRSVSSEGDSAWADALARARASLRYLDCNMLALDPAIILAMTGDERRTYVAHVILGLFGRPELDRALSDLFARREGHAAYWACVKLALIADAVFDGQEAASKRLVDMGACHDTDIWAVIEAFPPRAYMKAAGLLLGTGDGDLGEGIAEPGRDPQDVGRLRLRARVIAAVDRLPSAASLASLRLWLEHPPAFHAERPLAAIDADLTMDVGDTMFCDRVDLSGFHGMETDHVWMKGPRGFVGLKLGPAVTRIAFMVRQLHGTPEAPCTITLSRGTTKTAIVLDALDPYWIALDIPDGSLANDPVTWFQLSTSCAGPPPNSHDARVLGACFMRVRVSTSRPLSLVSADQEAARSLVERAS